MIERFVIFGASGDLTSRLLLPAMAELHAESALPEGLEIVGVGLDEWATADFRELMSGKLAEHAGAVDETARKRVVSSLEYEQADVTDAGRISGIVGGEAPVVAYLALPPALFLPTLEALADAGLPEGSVIAIEKPFGRSLQEARDLNHLLNTRFPDVRVFRNDHFLHDQTVQNILGLRFANLLLEPLWNAGHVERVDIVWDETLALEGRAGYYDGAGALRDMLQNHLLQILCFVAMEPPPSLRSRDLRDARFAVLRAVPTMSREDVARRTVRARYGAGAVDGRQVPAYAEEEGVDPGRGTETFAQVTLAVDNWRWAGTPFTLRSGKALGTARSEVIVSLRDVPHPAFAGTRGCRPNRIRIGLNRPGVDIELNINAEGELFGLTKADLQADFPEQVRTPYAGLILDALAGQETMSVRGDEAEEAWRIMAPVIDAWKAGAVPLGTYAAGSDGPDDAGRTS